MIHINKLNDQQKVRISNCEDYVQDKVRTVNKEMRDCERVVSKMATTQMMDKITEDNKALKVKIQEELEQFQ